MKNLTKICNLTCVLLMVLLLVLQFVPFWHYGEASGESTSISSLIWFPGDNGSCEKYLKANDPDFAIDQLLGTAIGILVLSAAGIVLCAMKSDRAWTALFPAGCGLIGTVGYLRHPALQLGSAWQLHLMLSIALLLLALVIAAECVVQHRRVQA